MTEQEVPLDVNSILQSVQYKSITVDKEDLQFDLGHLCAYDYVPLDNLEMKNNPDFLVELTRDNTQLLFTKIFQLPSKVVPDGVLAELPKPTTVLPRAKPLPQTKEPTSWEKFAKLKGIRKTKKSQLVWDESHQQWRRRWGHEKANNAEDQWVIPVGDRQSEQGTGGVDPFTKMKQDRKVRADKQEKKEKKNKTQAKLDKARTQASAGSKLKDDISRTFALVSRSTASLGRFDRRLPGESEAPKMKGTRKVAGVGAAVGDMKGEKSNNLALVEKLLAKEDQLNKGKATSQYMIREQQETRKRNRDELLSGKTKKRTKKA